VYVILPHKRSQVWKYYRSTTTILDRSLTLSLSLSLKTGFKGRVGCGLSMEWGLYIAIGLLVHGFFMIWCFMILNQRLQLAILGLDVKLGGAIQAEIQRIQETLMGSGEAAHPLQGFIQHLIAKNTESVPAIDALRGIDGKYA